MFRRKIGPISFCEVKFAISALPKQIIAQTEFTSGANQQLRVGHKARGELVLERFFGDVFSAKFSALHLLCELSCCLGDFPTRGVRQSEHHGHAGVGSRVLLTARQGFAHKLRESTSIAYDLQAHIIRHEKFFFETLYNECHEGCHFMRRSIPILRREGVECEIFHSQLRRRLGDVSHRLCALLVSHGAFQSTGFSPTSIAIHDDGDVSRDSTIVESVHKSISFVARGATG